MLGAFTTSIGAGMIFPDWPLSNNSLNPAGWLHNLAMFAEHSHRLSAGIMSALTLWLAAALWRCEERRWLRRLGWSAVVLVVLQALVGGLRVLLNPVEITSFDTTVGQIFAMLHACLAQAFVCVLLAIAAALSKSWIEAVPGRPPSAGAGLRWLGILCCGLLLAQLAIAAVMRHSFAGLAIPTFPLSPDGGFVPAHWNFGIAVNFAHRSMALVLAVSLGALAISVWTDPDAGPGWKSLASVMAFFLVVQIGLGASVIWTARNAYYTTAHVLVGALTLSATFLLTWGMHRDLLENASDGVRPGRRAGSPAFARVPARA
jgi:cytochrome c oxidase assembly protein subunit 15